MVPLCTYPKISQSTPCYDSDFILSAFEPGYYTAQKLFNRVYAPNFRFRYHKSATWLKILRKCLFSYLNKSHAMTVGFYPEIRRRLRHSVSLSAVFSPTSEQIEGKICYNYNVFADTCINYGKRYLRSFRMRPDLN